MSRKICIISEGSYPIVRGGLSAWTHLLIQQLSFIDFDVYCLASAERTQTLYNRLPNVDHFVVLALGQTNHHRKGSALPKAASTEVAKCLGAVLYGGALDCERLAHLFKQYLITKDWMGSKEYWNFIVDFYQQNCPDRDFAEFFWTTHGLYSMLLDTLSLVYKLPRTEVYHSSACGLGGLLGALAKMLHGGRFVISEHGAYLKEREVDLSRQDITAARKQQVITYFETVVRTSYKYVDVIMPITRNYIEGELRLGVPPDKIVVTPVGIDSNTFRPPPSKNGTVPLVGCFARVVAVKDQLNLIRACRRVLEKRAAYFIVVGEIQDEEYYSECQSLIREYGISEYFKFIGHTDNVLEWYHQVDVFVLSSQSEGVPLALLEAMSCGLPCVCTAVGGIPEILSDSGLGYVVPPRDPDSLAQSILTLLDNETLRKEIGTRARELVEREYTIEKMAGRILTVYADVLKKEAV